MVLHQEEGHPILNMGECLEATDALTQKGWELIMLNLSTGVIRPKPETSLSTLFDVIHTLEKCTGDCFVLDPSHSMVPFRAGICLRRLSLNKFD